MGLSRFWSSNIVSFRGFSGEGLRFEAKDSFVGGVNSGGDTAIYSDSKQGVTVPASPSSFYRGCGSRASAAVRGPDGTGCDCLQRKSPAGLEAGLSPRSGARVSHPQFPMAHAMGYSLSLLSKTGQGCALCW